MIKYRWYEAELYKGALPRWERFNHIENKKNAVLVFFTWRQRKKQNYFNSIFYKRIDKFFTILQIITL